MRYFSTNRSNAERQTAENTRDSENAKLAKFVEDSPDNHHYDKFASELPPGKVLASRSPYKSAKTFRRRDNFALDCPVRIDIEPIGESEQAFHEQRLLLGMVWFSETNAPSVQQEAHG